MLRADQELFLLLAAEHSGSLKAGAADQDPPLDAEVRRLMNDPRINVHLTPVQRAEKRAAPAISPSPGVPSRNNVNKRQKGETPKTPSQVPSELQGLHLKTKEGKTNLLAQKFEERMSECHQEWAIAALGITLA